jgi:hypothetical protein
MILDFYLYRDIFKAYELAAPTGVPRTAELTSPGSFLETWYHISPLFPPSANSSLLLHTHTESELELNKIPRQFSSHLSLEALV